MATLERSDEKRTMNSDIFQLCDKCSEIDFEAAVLHDFRWSILGHLDEIYTKSSTCTFCNLVATICKKSWVDNALLTDYKGERRSCFIGKERNFLEGQEPDLEAGQYYRNRLYINIGILRGLNSFPFGFCLRPSPVPVPRSIESRRNAPRMSGCQVEPLFAAPLLREWVNLCEKHHGNQCKEPPWLKGAGWPSGHRVIDVRTNKIIAAPNDCRYAALSYVWGERKQDTDYRCTREKVPLYTEDGGLLRISLPRTITDAMDVVRSLGNCYLWIDALCIVQDDNADLKLQISQMDLIYARALFTVVVASRDSADSGIPRVNQPNNDIVLDVCRVAKGLNLMSELRSSRDAEKTPYPWNQRGWTFQENLLSKRCVIFLENQVLWKCTQAVWKEGTVREPTPQGQQGVPKYLLFDVAGAQFGGNDNDSHTRFTLPYLSQVVAKYQMRRFSQESDVVDAFQGILQRVTGVSSELFHWGLPQSSFEQALLWSSDSTFRREERYIFRLTDGSAYPVDIPSWSWMGWNCQKFDHLIPSKYPGDRKSNAQRHEGLHWCKIGMDGMAMPLVRPLHEPIPTKETPRWMSPEQALPVPTQPAGSPFKDSGRIITYTSQATLRVQLLPCIEKRENKTHHVSYLVNVYAVLDTWGNRIAKLKKWGVSKIHPGDEDQLQIHTCHFIVLSEFGRLEKRREVNARSRTQEIRPYTDWDTHYMGPDDDDAFFRNEEEGGYDIQRTRTGQAYLRYELDLMRIAWNEEGTIARRVDLWSVWEDDWMRVEPKWKMVMLG
jgi:hypothetical protein